MNLKLFNSIDPVVENEELTEQEKQEMRVFFQALKEKRAATQKRKVQKSVRKTR